MAPKELSPRTATEIKRRRIFIFWSLLGWTWIFRNYSNCYRPPSGGSIGSGVGEGPGVGVGLPAGVGLGVGVGVGTGVGVGVGVADGVTFNIVIVAVRAVVSV